MKKVLLVLICLGLLVACDKRYEHGPALSFVKAENRLCGEWQAKEVLINQEAVSRELTDSLRSYLLIFNMNNSKCFVLTLRDTSGTTLAESLVRTDERLTQLTFGLQTLAGFETAAAAFYHAIPAFLEESAWTISRLKRQELWLERQQANRYFELHLDLVTDYQNL